MLFIRRSVSSTPFPFPPGTNPTPHQIFHLPRNASQRDIKTRYYELVKVYHPDAARGKNDSSSLRHAQFRAITHAYGVLRGRPSPDATCDDAIRAELRRRARRPSPPTTTTDSAANDAQLWYALLAGVLVGMMAAMGAVSAHMDRVARHSQSAAANLAQARTDAQVHGRERRRKIHERVRAHHEAREEADHLEAHRASRVWLAELSRAEKGVDR